MIRPVRSDPPFSTAGTGTDPETGYQDNVKRLLAWEDAHPGGRVELAGHEWTPLLGGEPFPFAEGTGPSWPDLGDALSRLDQAERQGLCPVHFPGQP